MELFKKSKPQNNIGDNIPKAPGRIWLKNLFRGNNSHERPSNAASPPEADISETPITPVPTEQRPHSSLPPTTQPLLTVPETDGDIGAVRGDPEVIGTPAAVVLPGALSINADDNAAPQSEDDLAETRGKTTIPVLPSAPARSSRDATTEDAITPVVRTDPDEQEGESINHRSKQDKSVLVQPASPQCGQSQRKREKKAMENVYLVLENSTKEHERMKIAIRIDMEDYEGTRRISVTCFDGSAKKAKEIKTTLSKAAKRFNGFSYVVYHKEDIRIFGFKGSDDRSPIDVASESFGHESDKGPGDDAHDDHQPHTSTHPTGYRDNHPDERGQPFSSTPYWMIGSTMVEVLCGDEMDGDIAAAPIRMKARGRDGSSTTSMWTCGGIIRVGGVDYGLTTAHPLVLGSPTRPRYSPPQSPSIEDTDMTEDLFAGNNPFGGSDDYFSAEAHPEKYWQAVGKVSHYALAKTGFLPRNNDWLLFELPKDRSMWNNFGQNTKLVSDDLAVFTARGILSAKSLEGTAFLILGSSPFEVLKIELQKPLRPGDSGSWLMRGSELVGVMIAGSEEDHEKPIGYAISAQELYRSISTSMGGLSVRPLTVLENAINEANQTGGSQVDLAVLRIRQLFDLDAPARRIKILPDHRTLSLLANIQTGNAVLTALLKLGFFYSSLGLDFATDRRPHLTIPPLWNTTKRIGEMLHQKLSQLNEGLAVTHLILALSASLPLSKVGAGTRECAKALSVLMEELLVFPLPAQNYLMALVGSVYHHYTLPEPLDVHYGGPKEETSPTSLARSLARALYAIRTDNFFVHEGVTARYLRKFVITYTRYPVLAVHDNFDKNIANDLTRPLMKTDVVPRIFIAKSDRPHTTRNAKSSDPLYGQVVEFDELNDVLDRLTSDRTAERRAAIRGKDESRMTSLFP